MAITLDPDANQQALASIKRYVREELDLDIGDLKAGSLLEFFLREIGPSIYNRAIGDAQRFIEERALDLESVCHEDEFGYWAPAPKGGRRR